VFKEIGLMEEWGTGLIGVAQELVERGLPPLEVVELPGGVRMIVHIKNHDVTPRTYSPDDVVTDVARDVTVDLTSSERSVLAILRTQALVPARELASQTGLTNRQEPPPSGRLTITEEAIFPSQTQLGSDWYRSD